jgi:hypothetical protein
MTVLPKKTDIKKETYPPQCAYCGRGRAAPDGESVLCLLCGVMRKSSSCKKFRYDPLKRVPHTTPVLPAFDEEEFRL